MAVADASTRIAPDHAALWQALKLEIKALLRSTQLRMLEAGGESVDEFARKALAAQGQWVAIQDVCALIDQLEDQEREGMLGAEEEEVHAPNGRGNRRAAARE